MGSVLERELAFYNEHQAEWMDLALAAGASRFGLDSFLVRKLGEAEQEVHVPALALGKRKRKR